MAKPEKVKRPSTTSAVTEALEVIDDFMSIEDLIDLTKHTPSRVRAAVHWLVECGAIAVVAQDGHTYYYRSLFTDQRSFVRDETVEHVKPRRRPRIVKVKNVRDTEQS